MCAPGRESRNLAHVFNNRLFISKLLLQLFRQPVDEIPAVGRRLDYAARDPTAGVSRGPREVVLPRVDDQRTTHNVLRGFKLGPNSIETF